MPLSMVEEPPQSSFKGGNEPTRGGDSSDMNHNGEYGARTLKRSPYLSEMTKTTNSDLMAMLSRPSGGIGQGTGRAMGSGANMARGVDFLQLKRPAGAGEVADSVPLTTKASTAR